MAPAYPVVSASHQMLWSAMPTFRRACGSLAPRFSGVPVPTQRSGLEGRRDPAVWVLSRPNFGPSLANFAANTCKHHILGSAETTGQAGVTLAGIAHTQTPGMKMRGPSHLPANFFAIWVTWRPWNRAIANSFSLGTRFPSAPARYVEAFWKLANWDFVAKNMKD